MITVPTYIVVRFVGRFFGFLDHWYRGGTRFFWSQFKDTIGSLEGIFAVVLTIRHLFEPLYQDRTVIGYILGFIFRTLRVAIGLVVYAFTTVAVFVFYLLWLSLPVFAVYKVLGGLILIDV